MKINFWLLVIISCLLLSCKAKQHVMKSEIKKEINYIPYYLKVYEADSLSIIGDYENSYRILHDLFKVYKPINITGYYECGTYLVSAYMTNHTEDISQKVREYYLKYGEIHVPSDKELKHRREMLNFSKITKKEIDSLRAMYFKNINHELRNNVISMMERDQYYRVKEFNDFKMDSVSRVQFEEIKNIFTQYGYPSKDIIGYDGLFDIEKPATIEAMLLHLSSENKAEIMPLLMSFIKNGTCTPDVYAAVYDKNVLILQNKQYYGAFTVGNEIDVSTLLDLKNITSIRKSIGLPSLYYNQWREKFLY